MLDSVKNWLKKILQYEALAETANVREIINAVRNSGQPYCPDEEGDLLFSLIRKHGYKNCLEVCFYTGSSALYMCDAVAIHSGHVTSICIDGDDAVAPGMKMLRDAGYANTHDLIQENSNQALPRKFLSNEKFDFIFIDGWKTFDHLAFEIYLANQILKQGGAIAFDDSQMVSVRKAIKLLQQYYGFEEIDYPEHNQSLRLRIFQILTCRSWQRPYRAFIKTLATEAQPPFGELTFHRPL